MIINLKNVKQAWRLLFTKSETKQEPKGTRQWLMPVGPFAQSKWQEPVTGDPEKQERAFSLLAPLSMCVRIRQNAMAQIRLKLMEQKSDGKSEEVPEHDLAMLFSRPNEYTSSFDFWSQQNGYLDLVGDSYIFFDNYVGKKPLEMWVPRPSQVRIEGDPKKFITGYNYYPFGNDQSKVIKFPPERVLHFKSFNPVDAFYGMSPVIPGSNELATDYYAAQYQKNFFANGGMPTIIFKLTGFDTPEQMKEWTEKWFLEYGGVENAWKVAFTNESIEEVSRGLTMKDMDFITGRKFLREYFFGWYHIPPMLGSVFEWANYANSREQRKSFWQDGMIPRLNLYLAGLTEILLPRFEGRSNPFWFEWDLSNVEAMQETSEERVNGIVKQWDSGLIKRNEGREALGWPLVDDTENTYKPAPASLFGFGDTVDSDDRTSKDLNFPQGTVERKIKPLVKVAANGRNEISFHTGAGEFKVELPAGAKEKLLTDEDSVEMLWKKFDARLQGQEKLFAKDMLVFFRGQKSRILENFDDVYPPAKKQFTEQSLEAIFRAVEENGHLKEVILRRFELIAKYAGSIVSEDIGAFIDFDLTNPRVQAFFQQRQALAEIINRTTSEQLRTRIAKAISEGLTTKELRDEIVALFDQISEGRAMVIAQTETTGAYNFGTLEAWRQSGVVAKKWWLSARDTKVRDSHKEMERITRANPIPMDSVFPNGLMFPGDQTGDASEVVNCRCVMQSVTTTE